MTSIRKMEIFSAVAELKSFTGAAGALYLTQPAISWQIKALEEEMGLNLFSRRDKQLELTEAGERFYQSCQQILSLYKRTEEDMAKYRGLSCGSLHIGASTIPGEYILPQLITRFTDLYPGLDISISIGGTGNIIKQLLHGNIDLAIVGAKVTETEVEYLKWVADEMILVTAYDSPLPELIEAKDLTKYPLIWREAASGSRMILEKSLAEKDIFFEQWPATLKFGSTQAVINAVLNSNSMAFISVWAANPLIENKQFRKINVPGLILNRYFYLANWQPDFMSNAALACKTFLEEYNEKQQKLK